MGMTIDEAFYCLSNDKYACSKCRHLCSKHNCRKEAVDMVTETRRKYQQQQADYENRLKADMVAMLTEIQLEIEETAKDAHINAFMNGYKDMYLNGISASAIKCSEIIQQKINSLKEA